MAITLAQHVPAENAAGGTNATATISAATVGQLIVGLARIALAAGSVTDPPGYTRLGAQADAASSEDLFIVYKVAAGGETAVTFTHASASWSLLVLVFSGAAASSPADGAAVGRDQTGTASTTTATAYTPSVSGDVCVGLASQDGDNGGSEAIDSSWTIQDAATFTRMVAGYKIKTDALAETPIFSWTTARNRALIIGGFLAAAATSVLDDRNMPRGTLRGTLRGTT